MTGVQTCALPIFDAVIGSAASELLPEIALAVRLKLKAADIAMTIHAHPTLSEVLMDAALDAVSKLEK